MVGPNEFRKCNITQRIKTVAIFISNTVCTILFMKTAHPPSCSGASISSWDGHLIFPYCTGLLKSEPFPISHSDSVSFTFCALVTSVPYNVAKRKIFRLLFCTGRLNAKRSNSGSPPLCHLRCNRPPSLDLLPFHEVLTSLFGTCRKRFSIPWKAILEVIEPLRSTLQSVVLWALVLLLSPSRRLLPNIVLQIIQNVA